MINSWNVYRLVALLNVFWNVIELGPFVAFVSTFLMFSSTKLLNFQLAHVILIALMAVKDARTQFASVM